MKKVFKNVKNVIVGASTAVITLSGSMPVFAGTSSTGISTVDTGMNVIKVAAIGIVSVIGVIGLAKGGMDLGTGVSQRDQQGIVQGAAEIGGGLIMAGIGVVIGLLGF